MSQETSIKEKLVLLCVIMESSNSRGFRKSSSSYVISVLTVSVGTWAWITMAVLCVLVAQHCGSVDIDSMHFGTFDFTELDKVLYDLELSSQPVTEQDVIDLGEASQLTLISKRGQRYSCNLPVVSTEEESTEQNDYDSSKLPNISTLLKPMLKGPCLTKTVGWWTYEYCHSQFIKQYHLEAGRVVGKTVWMGFFEKETHWDQQYVDRIKGIIDSMKNNIEDGVPIAYHSVYYVNGSECDLTGKPRKTTAKIYCAATGKDTIMEVHEKETCNYTLLVQSSLICSHPMFDPDRGDSPTMLTCSPVLSQQEYEEYLHKQELLRQQRETLMELEGTKQDTQSNGQGSLKDLFVKAIGKLLGVDNALFDSGFELDDDVDEDELEENEPDTKAANIRETQRTEDKSQRPDHKSKPSSSASSHSQQDDGATDEGETSLDSLVSNIFSNLLEETLSQMAEEEEEEGEQGRGKHPRVISKSIYEKLKAAENSAKEDSGHKVQSASSKPSARVQQEAQETIHNKLSSSSQKTKDTVWAKSVIVDRNINSDRKTSNSKGGQVTGPAVEQRDTTRLKEREDGSEFDIEDDEWDEETMRKVEQEVQDVLREQLTEAGLEGQAHVEVKILSIPAKKLESVEDELSEHKELADSADEDEEIDEWDEETVREVEQEVQDVLREQLTEAGLEGQAHVKVKILSMPAKKLDGLVEKEHEESADDELSELADGAPGSKEEGKVKIIKQTTQSLADSISRLVDDLLFQGDEYPLTEERRKQQKMEDNYDQVWGDGQKKQSKGSR